MDGCLRRCGAASSDSPDVCGVIMSRVRHSGKDDEPDFQLGDGAFFQVASDAKFEHCLSTVQIS